MATDITTSDSIAVAVSETDISSFQYGLVDGLALGLSDLSELDTGTQLLLTAIDAPLGVTISDTALILAGQQAEESISAGMGETASVIPMISALDDLLTTIIEAESVLGLVADGDGLSVTISDADIVNFEYGVQESLSLVLADSSSVDQVVVLTPITASDSIVVQLDEPDIYSQLVSSAEESLGISIAESASTPIPSITTSDDVAISTAESKIIAVSVLAGDTVTAQLSDASILDDGVTQRITASDSLQVTISDADILRFELSLLDQADARISDVATVRDATIIEITDADSVSCALTELASTVIAIPVSDSLRVFIEEPDTYNQHVFPVAEEIAASLAESATSLVAVPVGESVALTLTDAASIGSFINVSDSMRIGETEDDTIFVTIARGDELAEFLTEETSTYSIGTDDDVIAIGLGEQSAVEDLAAGFLAKATFDDLDILLTESSSGYSAGSTIEASLGGIQESASIVVYLATEDTITVGMQDDFNGNSVTLHSTDMLPAGYAEAVLQHILAASSDSLAIAFYEARLILNQFAAQDELAIVITETSEQVIASGFVELVASDGVRVSISESGVLFTRTVGTISPLVATVEYIGVNRRSVEDLELPKTVQVISS